MDQVLAQGVWIARARWLSGQEFIEARLSIRLAVAQGLRARGWCHQGHRREGTDPEPSSHAFALSSLPLFTIYITILLYSGKTLQYYYTFGSSIIIVIKILLVTYQ